MNATSSGVRAGISTRGLNLPFASRVGGGGGASGGLMGNNSRGRRPASVADAIGEQESFVADFSPLGRQLERKLSYSAPLYETTGERRELKHGKISLSPSQGSQHGFSGGGRIEGSPSPVPGRSGVGTVVRGGKEFSQRQTARQRLKLLRRSGNTGLKRTALIDE